MSRASHKASTYDVLKTLLISVLGENSEHHYKFLHNLRHWGVRDLFESPLLYSVLEHVRRHFYQLFHDERREKSAQLHTAGFGFGLRT